MLGGLRVNTVMAGKAGHDKARPSTAAPSPSSRAPAPPRPEDLESATFTNAIRGKGKLYVTADQAAVVTRILEGIYESERTGKPYYFD